MPTSNNILERVSYALVIPFFWCIGISVGAVILINVIVATFESTMIVGSQYMPQVCQNLYGKTSD